MKDAWMLSVGWSLALAAPAAAQGAKQYTLRMLAGGDTLTSEVVSRTPRRVDVDMVYKDPR